MTSVVRCATLAALGVLICNASSPAATASLDLLKRATKLNPSLNSYTASATLTARLRTGLPLRKTLNGTVYYLKPRRRIAFENVPPPLRQFSSLMAAAPTYEEAAAKYTITPQSDDGKRSTYMLVPKASGSRVKSVTVIVDDATAVVPQVAFDYTDGGKLTFDQTYAPVESYTLPTKAQIVARFPKYSADGTLDFSNYKPNAPVTPAQVATPAP